jgi:hypothetical protein
LVLVAIIIYVIKGNREQDKELKELKDELSNEKKRKAESQIGGSEYSMPQHSDF